MFPRSISPAPKVPCEDSFPKSFKTTGSWLTPGVEPSQKPPLLVFCRALLGPSLLSTILQNLISLIIPGPSLRFKFLGLRADNQSIKLSALIESPENALFEINKDGFEGRIENFNWRTVLREYAKRFYAEKKKKFWRRVIHIIYTILDMRFMFGKFFFVSDINFFLYILFRFSINSDGTIWW